MFPYARILTALMTAVAYQAPPRPVTWSLVMDAASRGRVAVLRARIDPGWHLYSLTQPAGGPSATRIEIIGDPPLRLAGTIERRPPDTIPDANFGIMSEVYDDSAAFRLRLAGLPSRHARLRVAVTFQACTSRICLLPHTDTLEVAVRP